MLLRVLAFFSLGYALYSWQIQSISGTRSSVLQEDLFFQSFVQEEGSHAGLFISREQKIFFGEGSFQSNDFTLNVGHRLHSYESGFLLANGGYFPQFFALASERPLGASLEYRNFPFYFMGAGYLSPKTQKDLTLLSFGFSWVEFWETKFYFRKRDVLQKYFLSNVAKIKNFSFELVSEKDAFRQAILKGKFQDITCYGVYFKNPQPSDEFQSKIYQNANEGLFLFFTGKSFRSQIIQKEKSLVSQTVFSIKSFAFYYRSQKNYSLPGFGYEHDHLGPLVEFYKASQSEAYQGVFGFHYEKKIKFALAFANSPWYVPIAPLFWPFYHDLDNMASEQILFSRGKTLSLILSMDLANFSAYFLYDHMANREIPIIFRVGYKAIF